MSIRLRPSPRTPRSSSPPRRAATALALTLALSLSLLGCAEAALFTQEDGLDGRWSGSAADGRDADFTVLTEGYVSHGIGRWNRIGVAFAALGPWRGPALLAVGQEAPRTVDLAYGATGLRLDTADGPWELTPATGSGPSASGPWSGYYQGEGLEISLAQDGATSPSAGGGFVAGQSVAVACSAPLAGSARCALLWPDGSRALASARRDGDGLVLEGFGPPRTLRREDSR